MRARSRSFQFDIVPLVVAKDQQSVPAADHDRNDRCVDEADDEPLLFDLDISASGTDDESIHSSDLESIPEVDNSQIDSDNDEAGDISIPTLGPQEIADFQAFKQQYIALR